MKRNISLFMILVLLLCSLFPTGALAAKRDWYLSDTSTTIVAGKSKLISLFNGYQYGEYKANGDYAGKWTSSNTDIATVNKMGTVKGISVGKATITYTSVDGVNKLTCKVQVLDNRLYLQTSPATYIGTDYCIRDQIAGTGNRLNGTISSNAPLRTISVNIYNASNKKVISYSKNFSGNGKSYNLARMSNSVNFESLGTGTYTIKVSAKTTEYSKTLISKSFKVNGVPKEKDKGTAIAAWASMRVGDPYSQELRGKENYTDCSYLSLWSYWQGTKVRLPADAASQYKYCVDNKKTIDRKDLKPGDLVFYGGAGNGRYLGIWHVDVVVSTDVFWGVKHAVMVSGGSTTPIKYHSMDGTQQANVYYGRPY